MSPDSKCDRIARSGSNKSHSPSLDLGWTERAAASSEPRDACGRRTPNPEGSDGDGRALSRSKTPTKAPNERHQAPKPSLMTGKSLSGTPDYIPASMYRAVPTTPIHDGDVTTTFGRSPVDSPNKFLSANVAIANSFNGKNFPLDVTLDGRDLCTDGRYDLFSSTSRGDQPVSPIVPMDDGPEFSRSSSVSGRSAMSQYGYDVMRAPEWTVYLERQETGFGIRIVGGMEEGTQVQHHSWFFSSAHWHSLTINIL